MKAHLIAALITAIVVGLFAVCFAYPKVPVVLAGALCVGTLYGMAYSIVSPHTDSEYGDWGA